MPVWGTFLLPPLTITSSTCSFMSAQILAGGSVCGARVVIPEGLVSLSPHAAGLGVILVLAAGKSCRPS
jgi:hypothetical protein